MPGKVKFHNLSDSEKRKYLGDFYDMVSSLKNREEAKNFFKDLLTLSEIVMISRRVQIAKMLLNDKTHEEIRKKLKVGFTTIAQVEKWLNGGFGGYEDVIKKHKNNHKELNEFDMYGEIPFSPEWVRKKYPLHYFLSNLLSKKR